MKPWKPQNSLYAHFLQTRNNLIGLSCPHSNGHDDDREFWQDVRRGTAIAVSMFVLLLIALEVQSWI